MNGERGTRNAELTGQVVRVATLAQTFRVLRSAFVIAQARAP